MEDPADCKEHAAMFYLPFEGKHYSLLTFLVTMYTLTTALWWRMRSYLIRTGIEQRSASLMLAAMYALSYPLWFELSRAHVAIGVFLLLAAGVWACLRGSLYCLAVLLGPDSELVWHGVLFAAQIKCIALVLLLVFAMVTPWNGLEDIGRSLTAWGVPATGRRTASPRTRNDCRLKTISARLLPSRRRIGLSRRLADIAEATAVLCRWRTRSGR